MLHKIDKSTIFLFVLIALPLIGFGLLRAVGAPNRDWAIGAAVLYLIPVLLLGLKKTSYKVAGSWIGIFLIIEFVYSVFFFDTNYKTLPPNMKQQFEIVGDVMPGFNGVQNVTTDEMGYRVTRKINYLEKPANTRRIFAIGASTTEQIYLDDHKTWTHLLQEELQKESSDQTIEVINTGLSGLRAEHHLATLKTIANYAPDQVLFLVGINDWNRQVRLSLSQGLAQKEFFRQFSPKLSLIGMAIDGIRAKRKAKKKAKKAAAAGIKQVDGVYYASNNQSFTRRVIKPYDVGDVSDEYRDHMMEIFEFCEAASFECVFLTQPNGYAETAEQSLIDRFWMTPPKEEYSVGMTAMNKLSSTYNEFLLDQAGQSQQKTCDLAHHVAPTIEHFYDDCHFNEGGAKRVSLLLKQCLNN